MTEKNLDTSEIEDESEQTTQWESIEDALIKNMDSYNAAEDGEAEKNKEPVPGIGERPRAEDGKFVAKSKDDTKLTSAEAAPAKAAPVDPKSSPSEAQTETPAAPITVSDPPSSYSKEAKAEWNKLPAAVQQAVIKREKEVSDGFAKKETELSAFRDIDAVMAPRRALLQQAGKTPAQAIDQMWRWHEQLSHPAYRGQAIAQLARDYGIDLSQSAPSFPNQGQFQGQYPQQDITQQLAPVLGPVYQQVQTLGQTVQQLQDERLQQEIALFASQIDPKGNKSHPHFDRARPFMARLLDGKIANDLETAYQMAVRADLELSAEIESEQKAKIEADRLATTEAEKKKADEAEAERKQKLTQQASNARRAAVSVRGSAPNGSVNSANQKRKSIEESLTDAFAAREARA